MKIKILAFCLVSALLLPGTLLFAHHSPSAVFDLKNVITMKGTVTKVDWVNPHIVVYFDAVGDDGKLESWKFESNPPKWFSQVGVTRADFAEAVGQMVTVGFVKALDGSKYGYLQKITFPNGNLIAIETPSEAKP